MNLSRLLRSTCGCLLLLALSAAGFGSVVTTTINLQQGAPSQLALVQNAIAINATENVLVIQVSPGYPRTIMLGSCDQSQTAWIYRTVSGSTTNQIYVAAGATLNLTFDQTTSIYFLQQTAGGDLNVLPLR